MKLRTFITLSIDWDTDEQKDPRDWDWYRLVNSDELHPTPVRVSHVTQTLRTKETNDL